jgi:hypothetical protein
MNVFVLDMGAQWLWPLALVIFMVIAILVEWLIMAVMKYNKRGKAFLDSLIVNLGSLAAGIIVGSITKGQFQFVFINVLLFYALTVLIEFGILYLLNRKTPISKTFYTSVIMNIASYLILYLNSLT